MKKALALTLAALFAISFMAIACDDDDSSSVDNEQACLDMYDAMTCGDYDPTGGGLIDIDEICGAYANYEACDFADYFDCVASCYECVDDVMEVDSDKLAGECMDTYNDLVADCS